MSGLFLRLAAQATGQRWTMLHSPARLPYQSLPERLQPTPEFATAPPSRADRQPSQVPTDQSQRVAPATPPTRHAPSGRLQEQAEKVTQEEWIAPLPRPGVTLRAKPAGLSGSAPEKHAEIRDPAALSALLPPQSPDDLSTPAPLIKCPLSCPCNPSPSRRCSLPTAARLARCWSERWTSSCYRSPAPGKPARSCPSSSRISLC